MDTVTVWLVVAYVSGVIVSIVFPYFLAWVETGEPFDVRMNAGRVLAAVFGLLPTLAMADFIAQLSALGIFGSFVFGIGFSQVGRFLQKSGGMAMRRSKA